MKKKFYRTEGHHACTKLTMGCVRCAALASPRAWSCICGLMNTELDLNCVECKEPKTEIQRQCACGHARRRHHEMNGKCQSSSRCKCEAFTAKAGERYERGDAR